MGMSQDQVRSLMDKDGNVAMPWIAQTNKEIGQGSEFDDDSECFDVDVNQILEKLEPLKNNMHKPAGFWPTHD